MEKLQDVLILHSWQYDQFNVFRSLLKFTLERTPSPKKGHLLAEEDSSSEDEGLNTSEM